MDDATRARSCNLFHALSNPVRLRIVEAIVAESKTVNEIASLLGISQSGASQHLSLLARAGVLVAEAKGTSRVYRVRGPRIGKILALIEEFCHVHQLYGDSVDESHEGSKE